MGGARRVVKVHTSERASQLVHARIKSSAAARLFRNPRAVSSANFARKEDDQMGVPRRKRRKKRPAEHESHGKLWRGSRAAAAAALERHLENYFCSYNIARECSGDSLSLSCAHGFLCNTVRTCCCCCGEDARDLLFIIDPVNGRFFYQGLVYIYLADLLLMIRAALDCTRECTHELSWAFNYETVEKVHWIYRPSRGQ